MEASISIHGISRSYSKSRAAVNNISLDIEPGTITAVIGSNGSGKSTLLNLLAGQDKVDSGSIHIYGHDPAQLSSTFRSTIGYANQQVIFDGEITGLETLKLFASLYGLRSDNEMSNILNLSTKFGFTSHVNKLVREYSGGLKQRLHLALSAIHNPKIWLLDEPTSALDPGGRLEFWDFAVSKRNDGTTIIISTHDLERVQKSADKVVILDDGAVLAFDAPKNVIENSTRSNWTVSFSNSPAEEKIKAIVDDKEFITRFELDDNKLIISSSNEEAMDVLVNEISNTLDLTIIEVKKRLPDLSTAFFDLTGKFNHPVHQKKKHRAKAL